MNCQTVTNNLGLVKNAGGLVGVGVTDLEEGNATTKGPGREAEFGVPQNQILFLEILI